MFARALGGLVCVAALLVVACSSSATTPKPAANVITGAQSCPADERQDLTFTGAITGHVACSIGRAECTKAATNSQGSIGLALPLNAKVGPNAVQFWFGWIFDAVGTYSAGPPGDEPSSARQGATLDGVGHWVSPDGAGTMTIAVDDAGGGSGSLALKLVSGAKTFSVQGTWACVKPPGF